MPAAHADLEDNPEPAGPLTELPFPPISKSHILHCSYHYWHPKYRAVTPKARLVPLPPAFVAYLRADGIVLPEEDGHGHGDSDSDGDRILSARNSEPDEDDEQDADPSKDWLDVHEAIKSTIAELGGKVVPKLNWSAPKDATWINATNNMECTTPNDVYLLLKSSDFVTHDLEHAFDGCVDANNHTFVTSPESSPAPTVDIPFHLVLRKQIMFNPAVEFRCFVRRRKLLGMCQRDLNHYDFLFKMKDSLCDKIQDFFEKKLRDTFPDENFAFDVYIPPPHERVWLIDINPWAPRTDPLLFSWLELLTMREPPTPAPDASLREDFVRLTLNGGPDGNQATAAIIPDEKNHGDEDEVEAEIFQPELRLIRKDDPEAYSFNTPQYSSHKLPRDVVDASQAGPSALRDFAEQWKEALERRQYEDAESDVE